MKDSKQPEMRVPQNSTEFANFVIIAARQCSLPPEEFFLGATEALAAAAISHTDSRENALAIMRTSLEHGTLLVSSFYEGPSKGAVLQ